MAKTKWPENEEITPHHYFKRIETYIQTILSILEKAVASFVTCATLKYLALFSLLEVFFP
jgi:hypothetical protein